MSVSEPPMRTVVVVDRKVAGATPRYHVAATTLCTKCGETVWLGPKTVTAVRGGAMPICVECAIEVIPPDAEKAGRLVEPPRRRWRR